MKNKIIRKNTMKKYNTSLGNISDKFPTARSTTGVRVVYKMRKGRTYQARISINKKEIILISTDNFNLACEIRKNAEKLYYDTIIAQAKANGDLKYD